MRHLLCRDFWDADAVRDDVREYVVEHPHDQEAVLVVDETGDVKKGVHTVGVQRQYTGTAGRIEKLPGRRLPCLCGCRGHAAVDRELRVPRPWNCDQDRCPAAGLGENILFATKPEPARTMIERFLDAGHHVDWIAGDEVYGGNPKLRSAMEERGLGYVLAVACAAEAATKAGKFRVDRMRTFCRRAPDRVGCPAPARDAGHGPCSERARTAGVAPLPGRDHDGHGLLPLFDGQVQFGGGTPGSTARTRRAGPATGRRCGPGTVGRRSAVAWPTSAAVRASCPSVTAVPAQPIARPSDLHVPRAKIISRSRSTFDTRPEVSMFMGTFQGLWPWGPSTDRALGDEPVDERRGRRDAQQDDQQA